MTKKSLLILLSATLAATPALAEGLRNLPFNKDEKRIEVTDRVWATTPGEASVCIWKDDKLAAVTYTVDDNWASDVDWWLEMGEKYNFRATWFLIVNWVLERPGFGGSWDVWKKVFDAGHEVQSHTVSHGANKDLTLDEEYGKAITIIEENMPGNRVRVLAFPGSGLQNDPEVARKYYIGARSVTGHVNPAQNINYMSTHSLGGGICLTETMANGGRHWAYTPDTINPESKLFRGWTCSHFHGVNTPEAREAAEKQFQYLKENEKDYWVAPFGAVVQYGQQRDTAELKVTKNNPKEIALLLTSKMAPEYFDYPLTVKVTVPKDWKNATAKQADKEIETKLVEHEGHKYVFVQVVPGRGEANLVANN